MKIGDKVWVLCLVLEVENNSVLVCGNGNKSWWVRDEDCKPVESEAVEPVKKETTQAQKLAERTLKAIWAANDDINEPPVVKQPLPSDPVNPSHYKQGSIECIEAIKSALDARFIGYLSGNILKYLWRWENKNGIEDLKKARWYLDRLIQEEEAK